MHTKRIQLSLFIDETESVEIEKIRSIFNPEQYALIKSHVTLCREDELGEIEKVLGNLERLNADCITIDFGKAVRFSNSKGVLLPAIDNNESFQALRVKVLQGIIKNPRIHEPHITLMHPRNSTCTDAVFQKIEQCIFSAKIQFNNISLIEQETGMPWNIVQKFELKNESKI
jgi:2'-5' RNA ligase superfamily